ncbi:conserved hypothetical protein [Salinibacter ruber M8]|uniref:Uncharacterized protein n=2 Tax=Salinibacter ruber TaxID=146919 RepID=D5HBV2_SALRM|nr:conserved hypothetical protein [Salinibacter ruber M8]
MFCGQEPPVEDPNSIFPYKNALVANPLVANPEAPAPGHEWRRTRFDLASKTVSSMNDDHDLDWYRAQWNELVDVLAVEDSDAVVSEVRRLRKQAEALSVQREVLVEAGVENPEKALQMIENMADQLEELYAERDHPELPVKPEEETNGTSG